MNELEKIKTKLSNYSGNQDLDIMIVSQASANIRVFIKWNDPFFKDRALERISTLIDIMAPVRSKYSTLYGLLVEAKEEMIVNR